MEYPITVNRDSYHKAMLMVLNFNLNLSNMELDMLSTLLKNDIKVVDTDARDLIRKVLNKDKFITNNYIKRLRNKGVFILNNTDKKLYINPSLLEICDDKKVSFEFNVI